MVAQLQSLNCNAIGLTGADGNLIPASKRPVKTIDYGFVGDVRSKEITPAQWEKIIDAGMIPIVAPLTHDGEGHILNTNADTIAQELAKALSGVYDVSLIYSFEKAGVLLDANDETTVIKTIDPQAFEKLKEEQKIFAGMIPKLENAFAAVNSGVKKVIIGKAENLVALLNGESGTSIVN
jgi:acetylglutamate kinase